MMGPSTLRCGRLVSLTAGLVLAVSAVSVRAVDPEKMPPADEPPPAVTPKQTKSTKATADKTAEKLVAFEVRDKPWNFVLEWVSELTNLPFVGTVKPTGTFTFIGPKG